MFVALKSFSGTDYVLRSGKIISLKGGCFLNEISKDDFESIKKEYPKFVEDCENGFIIVNDNAEVARKNTNKAVDDTLQETKNKQEKAQAKNASVTGAKVKKG